MSSTRDDEAGVKCVVVDGPVSNQRLVLAVYAPPSFLCCPVLGVGMLLLGLMQSVK